MRYFIIHEQSVSVWHLLLLLLLLYSDFSLRFVNKNAIIQNLFMEIYY